MPPPQLVALEKVFESTVTSLLALGGIVLFAMLFYGGFKYLTSGGDPKAAEGAQKTLTYSIGGIVILAGSFMILNLIKSFTGADITNFVIYKP